MKRLTVAATIGIAMVLALATGCSAPRTVRPAGGTAPSGPASASSEITAGVTLTVRLAKRTLPANTEQTATVTLRNSSEASATVFSFRGLRVLSASGALISDPTASIIYPSVNVALAPAAEKEWEAAFMVPGPGSYLVQAVLMEGRTVSAQVAFTSAAATGSPAAGAFDPTRWASTGKGASEGHRLAAARDLVARGLLSGKTVEEVLRLLGRPDASGIPLDYAPRPGAGDAGVYYGLIEGPRLTVGFHDGLVVLTDVLETAGAPEEALKVAGKWDVTGGGPLKQLELRPDGGLIRWVEIAGRLHRRYGRWRVSTPGRILCYGIRFGDNPDVAAMYSYRASGTGLALAWLDEKVQIEPELRDRRVKWTPWVGGPTHLSLTLEPRK